MRARSSRSVVPIALFVALLVVGLNTWFAVSAVRSLMQTESWLAHTWEVIGQETKLAQMLSQAESSARAFGLSGSEGNLPGFQQAQAHLPQEMDVFRDLTLDNNLQQQLVQQLRPIVQIRMARLQNLIDARRAGGLSAVADLVSTGLGQADMDRVQRVLHDMELEERRLLTERGGEVEQAGVRTLFAIGLACVLDLLMIGSVTWYFGQERELRLRAETLNEQARVARLEAERSAAEVLQLNADLEQRVKERTAELESTNRELEAFSYSVSHDLRAPLRTIDGFSLALSEDYSDVVDETGRDYIHRVRSGVQRMGQLIDSLLQLSRITRADVVRETVQPAAIAERVIETLQEENPGRDITFTVMGGPTAQADPKLLQVALENLLGNAVKFTSRREHAEVSFGWDEEKKAWRVKDNGAGFDMHYADKLFNAFNRLHGDKDFKGSGIGLATVARVIRRHHGRIWADSTVDHGATFWFTLG